MIRLILGSRDMTFCCVIIMLIDWGQKQNVNSEINAHTECIIDRKKVRNIQAVCSKKRYHLKRKIDSSSTY